MVRFAHVVDLLASLEDIENKVISLNPHQRWTRYRQLLLTWFTAHASALTRLDDSCVALLSTLFPAERADRVFGCRVPALGRIIPRCLRWGSGSVEDFQTRRKHASEDFATSVEKVQRQYDAGLPQHDLDIYRINQELDRLASNSAWSSAGLRDEFQDDSFVTAESILQPILCRLTAKQIKWFIRFILKDLSPICLAEFRSMILHAVHPDLTKVLSTLSDFHAAIAHIRSTERFPSAQPLLPIIGIPVARPCFAKGRSVQHCVSICRTTSYVMEPKYDGEYCQIHIDISTGSPGSIAIFSKSGRNSTDDRSEVHSWIYECLGTANGTHVFSQNCILEGELLVLDESSGTILPFQQLRGHVKGRHWLSKSGIQLASSAQERLIVVFYDCLLLDNVNLLHARYTERRAVLTRLLLHRPGNFVPFSPYMQFDFAGVSFQSARLLHMWLQVSIHYGMEGLVLKPTLPQASRDATAKGAQPWIKLKKDYIPGLGDTVDLLVVGARKNHSVSRQFRSLRWSQFFLATIDDVTEGAIESTSVSVVSIRASVTSGCISYDTAKAICDTGLYYHEKYERGRRLYELVELRNEPHAPQPDVIFNRSIIVEALGSGFVKDSCLPAYFIRHPRVLKLHSDRGLREAIGTAKLNHLAQHGVISHSSDPDTEAFSMADPTKDESLTYPEREVGPNYVTSANGTFSDIFTWLSNKSRNSDACFPLIIPETFQHWESHVQMPACYLESAFLREKSAMISAPEPISAFKESRGCRKRSPISFSSSSPGTSPDENIPYYKLDDLLASKRPCQRPHHSSVSAIRLPLLEIKGAQTTSCQPFLYSSRPSQASNFTLESSGERTVLMPQALNLYALCPANLVENESLAYKVEPDFDTWLKTIVAGQEAKHQARLTSRASMGLRSRHVVLIERNLLTASNDIIDRILSLKVIGEAEVIVCLDTVLSALGRVAEWDDSIDSAIALEMYTIATIQLRPEPRTNYLYVNHARCAGLRIDAFWQVKSERYIQELDDGHSLLAETK